MLARTETLLTYRIRLGVEGTKQEDWDAIGKC